MAPNGQASLHLPHPMHSSERKDTPPPSRGVSAWVGQTVAHGGFWHARQTMTTNPFLIPPAERMPIRDSPIPPLPDLRVHANMQSWQPTQRSTSTTDSLLAMTESPFPHYSNHRFVPTSRHSSTPASTPRQFNQYFSSLLVRLISQASSLIC